MIYLGLGSNIGDRCTWLRRGLCEIESRGLRIVQVSSLYLTEPVGDPAMPWFVNCVASLESMAPPGEVLRMCLEIEGSCGRVRTDDVPEPRPLDLDLLLHDAHVIDTPALRVPHPRLHEREFVLRPLAEIAGDLAHPTLGNTIAGLLEAHPDGGEGVWLLAPGDSLLADDPGIPGPPSRSTAVGYHGT